MKTVELSYSSQKDVRNHNNADTTANRLAVTGAEGTDSIPDGGYGWIVTFASFMCHFIADGIAFTFGIIYPDLLNAFGTKRSTTSLIGSLFVGVPLICGPIAGYFVNRYGCRASAMTGGVIAAAGMLLSSFAVSIEMLALSYGVVAGFGLSLVYVPASVIPSFWFEKRRALATGIAVAGSGLGTFAMAPLTEYLLSEYGWRGTLLVMSGLTLNFVVFGALFREVPATKLMLTANAQIKNQGIPSMSSSLSSLVSCQSFHSLHGERSSSAEMVTPLSSPSRCHHSTNTIFTGIEFESLVAVTPKISFNHEIRARSPLVTNNNPPMRPLLRSRHSMLPISRHDITSILSLAVHQQVIASCPELSISAEDGEAAEGGEESDKHSKQVIKPGKTASVCYKLRIAANELCDVKLLALPVYLIFFISNFTLSYAFDLPYIYIPDYAASLNISRPSFLISIIGIVNTFGQVLFGYLGDKKWIDTLALYGVSILICGAFVTAVPLMTTYTALACFSVMFGFLISASFSLETVVLIKILSLDQLTRAYGLLMFGQGLASLIGPPIGGKFQEYVAQFGNRIVTEC